MNPFRCVAPSVLLVLPLLSLPAWATEPELVLYEGARVVATTPRGTVGVTTGERFERSYDWNGCSLKAEMMARSSRWLGAKGIIDPAGRGPFGMLFGKLVGCNGISRPVVEEAQLHFKNQAAAERWLTYRMTLPFQPVWTHDGLVVGWGLSPGRAQINVDVYQLCVAGAWPTGLRGASDDAVHVTRTTDDGLVTRRPCVAAGPDDYYGKGAPWQKPPVPGPRATPDVAPDVLSRPLS